MKLEPEQRIMIDLLDGGSKTWSQIRCYLFLIHGSETRAEQTRREIGELIATGLVRSLENYQYQLTITGRSGASRRQEDNLKAEIDSDAPLPASDALDDQLRTIHVDERNAYAMRMEWSTLIGSIEGPTDWADQHDHYLYGLPKRTE